MNKRLLVLLTAGFFISNSVQANWLEDIWRSELRMEKLQGGILSSEGQMLNVQRDIKGLMDDLNDHMTGNSGWGNYRFHDYQSYGGSANDWVRVLEMAEQGQGSGDLGGMINGIFRQFPADSTVYNRGVHEHRNQQYYALKTQTILAARAASQLDYNKIQEQIAYQQMLQQQIEKTKELKAAIDLSNRIQVEGNLINLEILRQAALLNQQHAVNEQASVNSALFNARFLIRN